MRIGILGGTFDPVHRGHTYLARAVLKAFRLDQVLFMVSNLPPHKGRQQITSPFHRFAMVALETQGEENLCVCEWELTRKGFSYSVDTLRHFSRTYPQNQYCFIAGSDSLQEIHAWKQCDTLLREFTFIFVQRRGAKVDLGRLKISEALKDRIQIRGKLLRSPIQPGCSYLIQLNPPPISSTHIRQMIASGKRPSSRLLSPAVLEYIVKHQLYEKNENHS